MEKSKVMEYLDKAQDYANENSGCTKVAVGSVIVTPKRAKGETPTIHEVYGANRTLPCSCKEIGCKRVALYGEDSKNHRLPSDCRAIHSEVDAISQAAKFGISLKRAVMMITRYPCEACARAIATTGIKAVYYGRGQVISPETQRILILAGIKVVQVTDWTYEDTER